MHTFATHLAVMALTIAACAGVSLIKDWFTKPVPKDDSFKPFTDPVDSDSIKIIGEEKKEYKPYNWEEEDNSEFRPFWY